MPRHASLCSRVIPGVPGAQRLLLALLVVIGPGAVSAESPAEPHATVRALATLTSSRTARISSWDRTGGNKDGVSVPPGQTLTLAEIEGSGSILHFYVGTTTPSRINLRELVLRMYWDGETEPSVEVPFGDFFLTPNEAYVRPIQTALVVVNPGNTSGGSHGYNSYLPMPFGHGARITVENQSATDPSWLLFYHIEYETYATPIGPEIGRLHAQWSQQTTRASSVPTDQRNAVQWDGVNTSGQDNYVILDAAGQGRLVGLLLNIENVHRGPGGGRGRWYGEGDDMIFIDGERWPPSYHGTGTEEIFGGGCCPNEPYVGPYSGFLINERRDGENYAGNVSMFRWFVMDPVRFSKSIRWTIEHGHANNFENPYSSVAFWYQTEPHKPFPPLPPARQRLPSMPAGYEEARSAIFVTQDNLTTSPLDDLLPAQQDRLRAMRRDANRLFRNGQYREALEQLRQHAREIEQLEGPNSFPLERK